MPQLNGKIRYNGHLLNDYEVVSVGGDNDRKFGLNISTEYEDSVGDVPLFIKKKKERPSFEIQLFKCDRIGNPLPISDIELSELSRMLFAKEDIGILENNGVVYYGCFTGESISWRNSGRQGYITLNFELASPMAYSPIMLNPIRVKESKVIEIYNKSTASENIYCDIEFCLLDNTDSLVIKNLVNGKTLEINGMEINEKGNIHSDTREIVSNIDSDRNLFHLSNRGFKALELRYGRNMFEVKSKDCKIKFIHQNELTLI